MNILFVSSGSRLCFALKSEILCTHNATYPRCFLSLQWE